VEDINEERDTPALNKTMAMSIEHHGTTEKLLLSKTARHFKISSTCMGS